MSVTAPRLAGKIAVVTGGSSGIGLAIVEQFATSGAVVHVLDLNPGPVAGTTSRRVDVSVADDVERAMAEILERGPIDILVNCAGIAHIGTIEQTSAADFQRLFDVNVKGTYHCIRAVIGAMAARKAGIIINLASIAASAGLANRFAYSMTKGAIVAMTYSVARSHSHTVRGRLSRATLSRARGRDVRDAIGDTADRPHGHAARSRRPRALSRIGRSRIRHRHRLSD